MLLKPYEFTFDLQDLKNSIWDIYIRFAHVILFYTLYKMRADNVLKHQYLLYTSNNKEVLRELIDFCI